MQSAQEPTMWILQTFGDVVPLIRTNLQPWSSTMGIRNGNVTHDNQLQIQEDEHDCAINQRETNEMSA